MLEKEKNESHNSVKKNEPNEFSSKQKHKISHFLLSFPLIEKKKDLKIDFYHIDLRRFFEYFVNNSEV